MGPHRINELMARSDYVVVAAALTPDTRGMVSREQFAHSKQGQVLINIGRGPLVVEEDLIEVGCVCFSGGGKGESSGSNSA